MREDRSPDGCGALDRGEGAVRRPVTVAWPRRGKSGVQCRALGTTSAAMKNPFPGMNPWLEAYWRDVHARLLVYATEELSAELPPGLHARVDERSAIGAEDDHARQYLPDVALDLQGLIDQCYERGHFGTQIQHAHLPQPPLPEEEAAWAREILATSSESQ